MKYCELVDSTDRSSNYAWCMDHKKFATHCGPDGDTPVCETFANSDGCNCCPENYDKSEAPVVANAMVSVQVSGEYYDERTLNKVAFALEKAGLSGQKTLDAINEMQNAGILFRERS